MNNNIKLEFKKNTDDTYNVVCRFGLEGQEEDNILEATVPSFDPNRYVDYQKACRKQYRKTRLEPKYVVVQTQKDLDRIKQDLDKSAANVLRTMNSWGGIPEFDEIAKAIESRSENLQVAISTECTDIRRLPLHKWELFPDDVEVVFSRIKAQKPSRERHPDRIRILVILGNDKDISEGIKEDMKAIKEYCEPDAEVVPLTQPTKAVLTATLADAKGWDIIFFSGHSDTDEKNIGRIQINANDSLSMMELEEVLAPAIAKRVQIAIFNSCDGLGITPTLEKLNIDRLIVMRELIPDAIAQEFLKSFLQAFTGGARFDDAVKSARQQLTTFEDEYPYASWLPIVIQNRLVPSPTWQGLGKIRSPYKGLEPFTEADAANFYGREETIEQLTDLVSTKALVPILGASGSGKSSLVQAGLIPLLKQDAQQKWQILTMRPGLNPFISLAKAFSDNRVDLETIELDIELASKPDALTKKLAQMWMPQHRILLFIDQFEELFTQSSDKPDRAEQLETTCQLFLQSLADAVSNAPHFTLVFTLRNDFLPTLQGDRAHRDFKDLLERYYPLLLGGMTRDRLRAAITKPVANLNVKFEDGLVERLSQDVGDGDGTLPLLQLVLGLLWEQQQPRLLTHAGYEAICRHKGVKAVLAERAEEIYAEFVKQERVNQFRAVFFNLVSLGDGTMGTTRRIASFTDIGESNWRDIVVPLSTSRNRLLRTDFDEKTQVATVEIIHESLIQYWQRLKNWIENHQHELDRTREIEKAAIEWDRIRKIEKAAIEWDRGKRSKEYLWSGKRLKEAKKFSKNRDLVIPLSQVTKDFLVTCSVQQLSNIGGFGFLGMIAFGLLIGLPVVWLLLSSSMENYSGQEKIASTPVKNCDGRSSPRITTLGTLKISPNVNLENRNLSCLNLKDVILNNANLRRVNLEGTNLEGVDLSDANLENANLRRTYLRGARLINTNLSDSNLNNADLRNANLDRTMFGSALLEGVNLKGAYLFKANLASVRLANANLEGVNLEDAYLNNADLAGADLEGANLEGAIGINPEQIKLAKNWQNAKYSPEFRKKLGLEQSTPEAN